MGTLPAQVLAVDYRDVSGWAASRFGRALFRVLPALWKQCCEPEAPRARVAGA